MTFRDYALCGWCVRSDIALPELALWSGDGREPDLLFTLGKVPPRFERPRYESPIVQIDDLGRVRINIEDVCDYLVEDGKRIIIDPKLPHDARDIRLFLLGAAHGVACHQRGVLPIQGAAVEIDGRAVILAGPSGAGKSTLASAILARGHRILADEIAVLASIGQEGMILPGHRVIRLWRDAATNAGWPLDTLKTCRDGLDKFDQRFDAMQVAEPLKPLALIHLVGGPFDTITLEEVRGSFAVSALRGRTYRWRPLVAMIGNGPAMARVAAAARLVPRHLLLRRPQRYERLEATVDAILHGVREVAVA